MTEPSAIALHESCHAVAAAHSRAGLGSVEIKPDGSGLTKCLNPYASPDVRFKVNLLGAVGDVLLSGSHRDFEKAMAVARRDMAHAAAWAKGLGGAAYAERTTRWAVAWVKEHAAEIRTVARHLDARRRLSGDEVRVLLGLPVEARPMRATHAPRPRDFKPRPRVPAAILHTPGPALTAKPKAAPVRVVRVKFPRASKAELDKREAAQRWAMTNGLWVDPRRRP